MVTRGHLADPLALSSSSGNPLVGQSSMFVGQSSLIPANARISPTEAMHPPALGDTLPPRLTTTSNVIAGDNKRKMSVREGGVFWRSKEKEVEGNPIPIWK